MEPQPPLPLANGHGDSIVDRDVWLACAVPLSRLPTVGAEVYYFPDGHAEQCPAHLPAPLPAPHFFPCTVTDVSLGADDKTDEVFAKISLRPGLAAASRPDPASSNSPPLISYSTKELTQSDANCGGAFSVPRHCADHVWPKLDFEADPPMQNLVMHDTTGKPWQFRHIYRGKPRRHLLTTGWSKFVNAKLLVAGDILVFMRRPNGDLIVGLRRIPRYAAALHRPGAGGDAQDPGQPPPPPPRNALARVPPKDVMEAARLAAEGRPFTVTYYPRKAAGEFVVPRSEVEGALATRWEPGAQVRMQFMEAEDTQRTLWADGHVKAIRQNIAWRALEIEWDDSSPMSLQVGRFVNAWQVQRIAYPPLPNTVRICEAIAPLGPGDVSYPLMGSESQVMAMIFLPPIPAVMQGARHSAAAPSESSAMLTTPLPTRDMDLQMPPRTSASPPKNNPVSLLPRQKAKTIRLFGATIFVVQSDTDDDGYEEVNPAPLNGGGDAMDDDSAEKDV